MHRRPHRIDREATKARKFLSRYSYVSFRIHPGTNHPCVYLAGEDCMDWKARVFFLAHQRKCAMCGDITFWHQGEADHIEHVNKVVRCWCDENGRWLCKSCHKKRHVHPRFGEKSAVEAFNRIYGEEESDGRSSGVCSSEGRNAGHQENRT